MLPGRGHKHLVVRRHGPDAGRARKVRDLRDDLPGGQIEHDEPSGVHVVHVQPARIGIDALIIEAIGGAREGNLLHHA
jgi:hypothetical protein